MRCSFSLMFVVALLSVGCESDKATSPTTATAKFEEAQAKQTKLLVETFAHNAYPQWVVNHDQLCPKSIQELAPFINKKTVDPAGAALVMLCDDDAPDEAKGFGVFSVGADGIAKTADDITSWKPL